MNKVVLPHYGLYGMEDLPFNFDNDIIDFLNEENLTVPQFKALLTKNGMDYSQFKELVIKLMSDAGALKGLGIFEKKEGGTVVGNFLRSIFGNKENKRTAVTPIIGKTNPIDTVYNGHDYGKVSVDVPFETTNNDTSKKPFKETFVGGLLNDLFGTGVKYANGIVDERFSQNNQQFSNNYGTIGAQPSSNKMSSALIGIIAIGLILGGGIYYKNVNPKKSKS